MAKTRIIAGLELARAKFRMVVLENGSFLYAPEVDCSDGMKNGSVINLDNVTEAVVKLAEDINQKTGKRLNSVFVNISGLNIRQEAVNSVLTFLERGHEITRKNVSDLIESCKLVSIPVEKSLLYLLPLEYVLDGQDGIKDAVGLYGNRLEARLSIITAPFNQVQNITKAINAAGLEVEEFILTPLADAVSVLDAAEMREGVLLVDLKTDMTGLSIFKDGGLIFFEALPSGQAGITAGIAAGFNVPYELAEMLKLRYGFLDNMGQDRRNQDIIPLEWEGSRREISRGELNKLIKEGYELLFDLLLEKFRGMENFNNIMKRGAVVHGGCVSLEGFLEWAAQKLKWTVKIGTLRQDAGHLGNRYITSFGLARLGLEKEKKTAGWNSEPNLFKKAYQKAGELLTEYF